MKWIYTQDSGGTKGMFSHKVHSVTSKISFRLVHLVVVHKDFRGCGLGKKLMELTEEKAEE